MSSNWITVIGTLGGVALGGLLAYGRDLLGWRHERNVRWLPDKRELYSRYLKTAGEFQATSDFISNAISRERQGEDVPGDPNLAIERYLDAAGTHGEVLREVSLVAGAQVRAATARVGEALISLTIERVEREKDPATAADPPVPSPAHDEFWAATQEFEAAARRELGVADGDDP